MISAKYMITISLLLKKKKGCQNILFCWLIGYFRGANVDVLGFYKLLAGRMTREW